MRRESVTCDACGDEIVSVPRITVMLERVRGALVESVPNRDACGVTCGLKIVARMLNDELTTDEGMRGRLVNERGRVLLTFGTEVAK